MSPYGAMGGSECGNRIGGANYGCVLFSSWDMTTGRTTNWRRRPNADKQTISHICPLSPHHSAGQDSTQLNSTGSWVELSWVLKVTTSRRAMWSLWTHSQYSESQNLWQLDQLSWDESRVMITAPNRTQPVELSWVRSGAVIRALKRASKRGVFAFKCWTRMWPTIFILVCSRSSVRRLSKRECIVKLLSGQAL